MRSLRSDLIAEGEFGRYSLPRSIFEIGPEYASYHAPNYYVADAETLSPASSEPEADFIARLYRTYYRREPDPPGLNYWVLQLQSGAHSRASAEQTFATSPDMSPDPTKTLAQYLAQFAIVVGADRVLLPAAAQTVTVQTASGPVTVATRTATPQAQAGTSPLLLLGLGVLAIWALSK